MAVHALFPILNGIEVLDKSVSTYNVDRGTTVHEPIMAYLLDTNQGWVLIDTGCDLEVLRDPEMAARAFSVPPIVTEEQELGRQLAVLGLTPADVSMVIITHLHGDHAGGLGTFLHAPVWI